MKLLAVSVAFAPWALCRAEDSSTKSTDNIFKKFLEVAVSDEHHRLQPAKGKKHDGQVPKSHPVPKKKTVIVLEEDSSKKDGGLNPEVGQRAGSVAKSIEKKGEAQPQKPKAGEQPQEDSPKPDVQSELTFETPISASFLLKPLGAKEVTLTQAEAKEVRESFKTLERLSKDLEALRSRLQSALKKLLGPERDEKGSKPPTDLLNYNFIEVTETGQATKK